MLVFILLGVLLGIFAGLVPGLHSNTVISILSNFELNQIEIIIIAIIPAHLIVSFIPSIFFGIPEQQTVVSVLPGQRMTLEGKGLVALKTVLLSILLATLISMIIFPVSLWFFPIAYGAIREWIKYIVLGLSLILLLRARNLLFSCLIFVLAGAMGYMSLNSGLSDPFLPLFSGLYAVPSLLLYKFQKIKVQKDLPLRDFNLIYVFLGVIGGILADLLPGISSPGQVATFLTIFLPLNSLSYLSAVASISTSQVIFAISTAASIDKARVGGIAILEKFVDLDKDPTHFLLLFFISVAITCSLVYILRTKLGVVSNLNMTSINKILLFYLIFIVFVLDGMPGLLILGISSALGYITINFGVARTLLMGAVIIPTLLLLFRIFI